MSILYLLFNPLPQYIKTLLQCLGLHAPTEGCTDLIPAHGTRIPHAEQCGKKKPKKQKTWSPKLNMYVRKYQCVRRQGRKSTKPESSISALQSTTLPALTTIRTECRPELWNSRVIKKPNSEMTVVITCEIGFLRREKKKKNNLTPNILRAGRSVVLSLYF